MEELNKLRKQLEDYSNNRESMPVDSMIKEIDNIQVNVLKSEWISVDEKLPDLDEDVFVKMIGPYGDDEYAVTFRTDDSDINVDVNNFVVDACNEVVEWTPIKNIL